MKIKVRENSNNKLKDQDKLIEINLTDIGDYDLSETALSVTSVSKPTGAGLIKHSNNTDEGVYLNYGENSQLVMTLTLPDEGAYSVKILAKNIKLSNGEITNTKMNANGDLVDVTTIGLVPTVTLFESNPLTLNYDTTENSWV